MSDNVFEKMDFFGMRVWSHFDSVISNNALNLEYFYFLKNKVVSQPKYKLVISGKSANKDSRITLDSSNLYKLSYQIKSEILKNIKQDIEKFKTDQKWSHGFCFSSAYNKNVYITVMWNDLSNSPVIRFMIGEKERTILDSDKVYIPLVEFFSFCEILNQSFNNYVNLCSNCELTAKLHSVGNISSSNEEVKIDNSPDLDNVGIPLIANISSNQYEDSKVEVIRDDDIIDKKTEVSKVDLIDDITLDNIKTEEKKIETVIEKTVESETQNDFDSFLVNNRDKFELDLPKETSNTPDLKNDLEKPSKFIEKICNNDFNNLEQLMFNIVNEDTPINSFVELLKSKCDIDFSAGIAPKDFVSMNYVTTNALKYNMNQFLEKKCKLPANITPIIVESNDSNLDKIDTMYYLLLFYIYLSKVKVILGEKTNNSIENKEFFSYVLKAVTNPLVFSYLPGIQLDVLKSETINRYRKLVESKFFDKFISSIETNVHVKAEINCDQISENVEKIYNSVIKFKDKLHISNAFDSRYCKLSYNHMDYIENIEIVKKVVHFDMHFMKYGKVGQNINLKSYDDVPMNILKVFGIKTLKFDNTIILEYFKKHHNGFKDFEKIKKINKNVHDIINDIEIMTYDTEILKALYFWDTERLSRDITLFKFEEIIKNCKLEKNQLISLILDPCKHTDNSFYTSFLIAASDD